VVDDGDLEQGSLRDSGAAGQGERGQDLEAITAAGAASFINARRAWREAQDAVVDALGAAAPAALDGWLTGLGVAER
jgi:hypothetical protein